MFDKFMGNNLGYTINPDYDMNTHIEQGVQFNKKSNIINEHQLLEVSSSPMLGSIVEAFNDEYSVNQHNQIRFSPMSEDQTNFNNIVSQYARDQYEYTYMGLNSTPSEAARMEMERSLNDQKNTILAAANGINNNMKDLRWAVTNNQNKITNNISELNQYHSLATDIKNNFDSTSVSGQIETTELNMNSMYYHYLVYFILSITLIAFTFNIIVNPDANVMNAVVVLVALVIVYLISRYYAI
jgi:hypothetical protein